MQVFKYECNHMTIITPFVVELSILCAVASSMLVLKMFRPGNIFDFFPVIVNQFILNAKIKKVLYECEVCLAGQFGLWVYLISMVNSGYSLIHHVNVIFLSMFFAMLIGRIAR